LLRIHFTGQDLENIRIARSPDPLWEIVCSVCRLQTKEGPLAFDPWRRTEDDLQNTPWDNMIDGVRVC
jgi:hypothetical protein